MMMLPIVALLVALIQCSTDLYSQTEDQLSLYPRPYYYQEKVGNKDTIKPCNASFCQTCFYNATATEVKCFNCLDGYYLDSDLKCRPCLDQETGALPLCAKCIGGTMADCYQTVSQYYFDMYDAGENSDGTKKQKITKCPQSNVNSAMVGCKECLYCYDCELPNKKKSMGCSECESGYMLDQHINECVLVSDSNCEEFYTDDIHSCKRCKEGYSVSSLTSTVTNKRQLLCEPCDVTNCKSCNPIDPYTCLQCKNGYFLEQIVPKPAGEKDHKSLCKIFRDTGSTDVAEKVVYDTKGGYTETDTNIICNNPYFIENTKFCLSCNTGYSKIKVKTQNQSCGNLLSCKRIKSQVVNENVNDFMNCLECNDGYLRYSVDKYEYKIYEGGKDVTISVSGTIGRCSVYEDTKNSTNQLKYPGSQTCPEGCKTCIYDSENGGNGFISCESCYDNYYLENKKCNRCSTHCQKCNNTEICTQCYPPYHSDINNKCVLCNTGCAVCYVAKSEKQQQQICQKCSLGYHHQVKPGSTNQCLKDGTTFKCDPLAGQLRHFSKNTNQCFDCAVNKCAKCNNFRYDCSTCDNQMFSLTQPFYWKNIVEETTVCRTQTNILPFCKYGTNEQCVECQEDSTDPNNLKSYRYDIQQFKCLKNCNVGQYEVRKSGNNKDGQTFYQDMCITCMDNCKACSYDPNTLFPKCNICNKGYYLLLGYCQACPPQCTECKSELFCTSCQSEFKTHQNFILNIRFCGKDETGYVQNTDRYLSSVDFVPCIDNCDICAPGYFILESEKKCYDQCPYKYQENKLTGKCDVNPSPKIVQILPTIQEFSPFTQTVFMLENQCGFIASQVWTIQKLNTATNQYESFKLIDTVEDVYYLNKISISGNNLDPSAKYKLTVEAGCSINDLVENKIDSIEFTRSESYHNYGQMSIKGVDQNKVQNIKFEISTINNEDSFTFQYSQFNKMYYEIILYYVKIFSGTVSDTFDYNKVYDTNDNSNITIDKLLYSDYFQTNDKEVYYKLPPLHGFENEGKDLYIEMKMAGYRQYGGYIKYAKFRYTTVNSPKLFIEDYEKKIAANSTLKQDFKLYYLYWATKYYEDKYRYSRNDADIGDLKKDDNHYLAVRMYQELNITKTQLTSTGARMDIQQLMQMLMVYKQIMSYTDLLNTTLFKDTMDQISFMYDKGITDDIDQMTFQDYFVFYQLILVSFEQITKDEKDRKNLWSMQQDQIIKIILSLIRKNQEIYKIQLFQVGSSNSIICLSSLLFNSRQHSVNGLSLKSPKACEENQNKDSSGQENKFKSQSQVVFPIVSYYNSSIYDKTSQFQALLMNVNSNIFMNIQDDSKQLLESSIVYVGLYNISGQQQKVLPTDFYEQLVSIRYWLYFMIAFLSIWG